MTRSTNTWIAHPARTLCAGSGPGEVFRTTRKGGSHVPVDGSSDSLLAEDMLFLPEHSLIDQSLRSRMGATTTNGDGFGIGWYGVGPTPALFKAIEPAWNDRTLPGTGRPNYDQAALRAHPRLHRDASGRRGCCRVPAVPHAEPQSERERLAPMAFAVMIFV